MKNNIIAVILGIVLVGLSAGILEVYFRAFVPPKNDSYSFAPLSFVDVPEAHLSKELTAQIKEDPVMKWRGLRSASENDFFSDGIDISQKGPLGCCVLKGYFASPGAVQSRVYSRRRELLYDAKFTFDQRGRRITPVADKPSKSLLLLGDSYSLGEGVDDEESFPYVLGTFRPSTQVYNLGLMGGSPNQTLYEVTRLPEKRLPDLPDHEVTAVYTFMADHMERLICRSLCLTPNGNWRLDQPFYSSRGGKPFFEGAFEDRKLLNSIYSLFHKSAIVQGMGLVLPPRFTQKDFDFFATVMIEVRDALRIKYPKLNFYVAMYPRDSHPYANEVTAACRRKGLNVLNYASVDTSTLAQGREKIVGDGHPSPIAHMIFARLLDRDLPR